jgi:hypothetical protein
MAHANASPATGDREARQVLCQFGRTDLALNSHLGDATQAPLRAELIGSDTCAIAAGITARGPSPVLALCRKLTEAGCDPRRRLHAYRDGTLCLIVRSIGEAARLTVEDRPGGGKPPRFIRHRPMSDRAEGSPSIAPFGKSDRAIPETAE